ncbi:MAG: hypothetical protein RIC89_08865 [Pseudomonadales bacterium]
MHAALAGLGLVQLPTFYLEKEVAADRLVRVLHEYAPRFSEFDAL